MLYTQTENATEELKQEGIERANVATRQYAKRQARWIRLKLVTALKDFVLENRMFLLDASNLSQWSLNVERKAIDITASFLHGDSLTRTVSLSKVAKTMLISNDKQHRLARHCELCDKSLMSEEEWAIALERTMALLTVLSNQGLDERA